MLLLFGVWSVTLDITDTDVVQKPVDYFMWGLPQYRDRYRTKDGLSSITKYEVSVTGSKAGRLSGPIPSFTSRTGKRGYD